MVQVAERIRQHKPKSSTPTHAPSSSRVARLPVSSLAMRSPLIQPKLTVNQPNDKYEQEADAVAKAVTHSPMPIAQPDVSRASIQRMSLEEEPVQRLTADDQDVLRRMATDDEPIQRLASDDEPIQQKAVGSPQVSARTAATIRSPDAGFPLPTSTRHRIEPHVGANLSGVRIHTDSSAHRATASLNARAFTHGNHIFLNRSESSHNLGLMAHEATHVVQQGAAPIQRQTINQITPRSNIQAKCKHCAAQDGSAMQLQEETQENPIQTLTIRRQTEDTESVQCLATIQRQEDSFVEGFWTILEEIAPAALVSLLQQIHAQGGIIPYLTQLIRGVVDRLFAGLGDRSELLNSIIEQFNVFLTNAEGILTALSQGDCQPLLDAVERMQQDLQQMANDAWEAVVDFFQPVGEFFNDLWESFGAPAIDWIRETAGDIWQEIENIANDIWEWTAPIRDAITGAFTSAWDWVKEQLGIPDSADDSGGLIDWIQEKASEAWSALQEVLEPVIAPIRQVYEKILEILPLDAILNLRETIQEWLNSAGSMVETMEEEDGITEQQGSLREMILPGLLRAIARVRNSLVGAGRWVTLQIGSLVTRFTSLVSAVRSNVLISRLASTLQWLETGALNLGQWAQGTVVSLFNTIDSGLARLATFVEPVFNTLERLVSVIGDVIGNLSDLVLGATWRRIPECIREPIKNFIGQHILRHIPIFGQLVQDPEIWTRMQTTAMRIIHHVFVSGDLLRAAWNLFSRMLEILGIPAELVRSILGRAVSAFSDILSNPVSFLINLLRAAKQGLIQFFGNIGRHLLNGLSGWLFGQLQGTGITPPTDVNFASIFRLIIQILGITRETFFRSLQRHIGRQRIARLRRIFNTLTGVWGWVATLIREGPAGLWRQFQERLSNLWETVRDSVISWITQTVVVRATARLLSMLDPTGIMAVVNSLVAMYQAIQSFAEHFRSMLEIFNSVLGGINEIAQGVITRGANILENSLVRALPIAISFLANQARIRNVGRRIRQIVRRLQRRIQRAIDRLVTRAWRMGRRMLERLLRAGRAARRGIGAVAEWWRARREFTATDRSSHALFFEGQGTSAVLKINPVPLPVSNFLARVRSTSEYNSGDETIRQAYQAARNKLNEIERAKRLIESGPNPRQPRDIENLNEKLRELTGILSPLVPVVYPAPTQTPGSAPVTVGEWIKVIRSDSIAVVTEISTHPSAPGDPFIRFEIRTPRHGGYGRDRSSLASGFLASSLGSNFAKYSREELRSLYLGGTPNNARSREIVRARMEEENKAKVENGVNLIKARDGVWWNMEDCDMSHIVDAVTWWNSNGRFTGARSRTVRGFMEDLDNYELEPSGPNRARGAASGERYLPPPPGVV